MRSFKGDVHKYANLLKILGHPIRLCILNCLMTEPSKVSRLQQCLELPQATVSQHLSILKSSGVIYGERHGLEITYSIVNNQVKSLISVFMSDENVKGDDKCFSRNP